MTHKEEIIQLYESNLSLRKIFSTGKFTKSEIHEALKGRTRSLSDAAKNARKLYPKKLSCKHKEKIANALKTAHKEGRHQGWKFINEDKNRRSYPEQFLFNIFKENGLFEKYKIEEKLPVGKYFLDFALIDFKLDIEVDGRTHFKDKKSINHDKKRNEYLINRGWKIYRIAWSQFCKHKRKSINELLNFIENIHNETNHFYSINDVIKQKPIKKNQYDDNQKKYINMIMNSTTINFNKYGWVKEVAKILGCKPQKVNKWMKRFMPKFYEEKCFKRSCSTIG